MVYRPDTAKPMNELAHALLRGTESLTAGERELIATFVSSLNDCHYCQSIHGAVAAYHLGIDEDLVRAVKANYQAADISAKLKSLLRIAEKVWHSGKEVDLSDIQNARQQDASDLEIHDAVLIAAAFSMFNRYVDGLATWQPDNPDFYRSRGGVVARDGYLNLKRDPVAFR
ncbi:MAG TPA: peroxidase-related enzyme [Bryobacteraceae bacterium]|jgi:uncharacterized peroxidase-related enzyme